MVLEQKKSNKKKGGAKKAAFSQLDEDDVASVSPVVPSLDEVEKDEGEEEETLMFAGKKKGKKGKKDKKQSADDYPEFDPEAEAESEEEEDMDFSGAKKKNNKKKGGAKMASFSLLDEDENDNEVASVVPSLDEVDKDEAEEEDAVMFAGKKKGKKGKKDKKQSVDDYPLLDPEAEAEAEAEEAEEAVDFSAAKKKSNKKKGGAMKGGFSLLDEDMSDSEVTSGSLAVPALDEAEKDEDDEEDTLMFAGKKKGKKGKKDKKQSVDDYPVLDPEAEAEEAEEAVNVSASKKKSTKKNGPATKSAFSLLDEDEDMSDSEVASGSPAVPALDEPEKDEDEEVETLTFAGKKKGKKGKKDKKTSKDDEDIDGLIGELEGHKITEAAASAAAPAEPKGKQKKKGKKSGRTIQEEEDLDAILAELEGPSRLAPAPPAPEAVVPASVSPALVEAVEPIAGEKSSAAGAAVPDAEEVTESASSKKKKKKKEKEKAAKAGAVDKPAEEITVEEKKAPVKVEEAKGKGKAVPKHVREMQERLARMKEAEEKRIQEEEEKRRKEEEEQQRLEELEREKEETKRRRKEREKEKLLQKKKEGKLLTGKKKEEARRLAIMREQFGITTDQDSPTGEESSAPRKPKYETKKKRKPPGAGQAVDATPVAEEAEMAEPPVLEPEPEVEPELELEPEPEPEPEPVAAMEEEEEEEEDWDAKSFEEVNLPAIKSAFAEEEADDGPVKAGQVTVPPPSAPPAGTKPSSPKKKPAPPSKSQQKVVESEDEDEEEDEDDEDEDSEDDADVKKRQQAKVRREARRAEALKKRSAEDLRSPICCILGHVDTGKTKLLDCIRRTNVQEGEAGGITQQIGATYFPMENIRERTKELKADAKLRVPGLLVIDTPGHESFTNLRARGSSLCDIAILVIDIMHGLEPQTIESLNLLKARHTPFVVALNKVDRLYGWKSCPNAPIRNAFKVQSKDVMGEFEQRVAQISTQLKEQGLNSELYYKNKELRKFISIIPTSAISGEGVPDILMLLVQLTQKLMEDKLMYISEVQATVLEVKVVEGLGTTIDVVLVNGVLHEGDKIVVCGMQGPIVTSIRALLTPHPMKELRVKGSYQHHKELRAAQGIKITAQGLEHAIAGTQLYVVGPEDDEDDIKDEAMQDIRNVMSRIDKSGEGVCVQASTLGSLEALLEFLKSPAVKIPVSGISIGPVHKKDVMRASVMLERKRKEFATILAFDVKVTTEAKELAEEVGVRIFTADIIYHLFDQFTAYMNSVKEEKRKDASEEAVFPCVMKIMPQCVFNKKDPIVVGVDILDGVAKVGTPLCIPSRDGIDIGKIASMEVNHKVVDTAKKGQTVAMKIVGTNAEENSRMFGRHFDMEDEFVSRITRRSIDLLKENYRDDLTTEEWRLVVKLKKLFEIP